ncbi:thioredoxin family protein [Kangiella aquimarina]|uniref:Thioredoxin family protein n=1 Tax=Kangiella aquimarina TaxID=261965 RepID=A0ABZ0X711_9GAMM|nr:thioredoxin family protein [Kangiella aquimarina]WQG86159.1 thioredoxin family protein [Kangiella aquimarina]
MKRIIQLSILAVLPLMVISGCQTSSSESNQKPTILVGDISYPDVVKTYPYFLAAHSNNQASPAAIEQLKSITQPTHLTVYFGVWCHDSIREIPDLMQILNEVNNPNISYQLISLDMKKQEPKGRAKANDILYTPTIVVYQNDKELGRIVEKPEKDLATDLVRILELSRLGSI